jgi:hypothetical protein
VYCQLYRTKNEGIRPHVENLSPFYRLKSQMVTHAPGCSLAPRPPFTSVPWFHLRASTPTKWVPARFHTRRLCYCSPCSRPDCCSEHPAPLASNIRLEPPTHQGVSNISLPIKVPLPLPALSQRGLPPVPAPWYA